MFYDEGPFGRKPFRAEKDNKRAKSDKRKRKNNRWQATDREFRCAHCKQMVFLTSDMGTVHRNHCPHCLHSLHVDTKPGNRASTCQSRMEPIGLTVKHNGFDKYGRERGGDIMLVHACTGCGTININRIAGDDSCREILAVFERSLAMGDDQRRAVEKAGVRLLLFEDSEVLRTALFGISLV
ncbi:RNHCP domain-containing protein [uncultured Cohaesibacter sp.]|uniref:RNHCP domain-containing protein n=1 Tax=uncultured Cohaesibacter sp. TaxID=1002546 RepID=UPI0029C681CC|nr:RNHCP domain-containing protein [uncultured Cohaesibacter sp.]